VQAGLPPGTHPTPWGYDVKVAPGAGARHAVHGWLAGSALTPDVGVASALRWLTAPPASLPPCAVWAMATSNPAGVLGLTGGRGRLAPGAAADVVLWREGDGGALHAHTTWSAGVVAWQEGAAGAGGAAAAGAGAAHAPAPVPVALPPAAPAGVDRLVARLLAARDAGAAWLATQQRGDGAVGCPEAAGCGPYYKALAAFTAAGMTAAANRLCSWVATHVQTAEGDFSGPLRGTGLDDYGFYAYPGAWLVSGAARLGRHDVAHRGLAFLLTLQDAACGGVRQTRAPPAARCDVLNTSAVGLAALALGAMPEALAAGRFLATVWGAQPAPATELFFVFAPGGGLVTGAPADAQARHSVRADLGAGQPFYNAGIAAAFLARLTLATGDASWAALAGEFVDFSSRCSPAQLDTAQCGKVGWGAALTAAITKAPAHAALAARVAEALLSQQLPSGAWDNTGGYKDDALRAEVTAVSRDAARAGPRVRAAVNSNPRPPPETGVRCALRRNGCGAGRRRARQRAGALAAARRRARRRRRRAARAHRRRTGGSRHAGGHPRHGRRRRQHPARVRARARGGGRLRPRAAHDPSALQGAQVHADPRAAD